MNDSLDQLARRTANGDEPLTRRTVLGRGLLAAVALSAVGRLASAAPADAAASGCKSLKNCLAAKEKFWLKVLDECEENFREALTGKDPARRAEALKQMAQYNCWDTYTEGIHHSQQYCFTECPPPKGGRKVKAPTQTKTSAPAPPQETQQLIFDECTNCVSVGGACCFGSATSHATSLCACANPHYSCKVYGCG